jgi:transposase
MRGADITQESLFTTATLANFVPDDHPLREIRALVDEALGRMNCLFSTLYPETGRASIAPEKLLRAQLLQLFYSIRSERLLMEQLQYNLLFRWFVGIAIDEAVWDHSVFSKNRDRLNGSAVGWASSPPDWLQQSRRQGLRARPGRRGDQPPVRRRRSRTQREPDVHGYVGPAPHADHALRVRRQGASDRDH